MTSAIDWENEASMYNWHFKYDLQCMPKAQQGLISSMFFLGWCTTLLWMPRLGDIYGRKKLVLWDNFVSLVLYAGVFLAPSIYVLQAVLFAWGFFASIRTNIGFCYMIEMMPRNWQSFVGTMWNCIEGLINLWATLWFMGVSTHWEGFVSLGLLLQFFSAATCFLLPESPIYLLKTKKFDELKEALKTIGEWNGTELDWDELDFDD